MRTFLASCTLLVASLVLPGCGTSGPKLGTVVGTVTLDGQPLNEASVEFQPAEGSASYGRTDATGHYELSFGGDNKGAVPGEHTVRITLPSAGDSGTAAPQLPTKYNTDSELTATVKEGANTLDFDLTSGEE
jgi:hypothetical protein